MADSFLGRWSQRKQALRTGQAVDEPSPPSVRPEPSGAAQGQPAAGAVASSPAGLRQARPQQAEAATGVSAEAPPPPPTLQDVQRLTPQSDFKRFVATDVDPEVRHAAMRKLFSDPHFNVMDGLDIYIDDYNTPNPMPASMLRQMASAHFLGLVEEEKKPVAASAGPSAAEHPTPDPAAPAAEPAEPPVAQASAAESDETTHHDDPDLRLQQDHASGPQGSGRGA